MSERKILAIYVEPTSYILGLVSILNRLWSGGVDVLFMKQNASQAWSLELDHRYMAVLPDKLVDALNVVRGRLATNEYGLLHVAGWAPLLMPTAMLLAYHRRIPVTMETDTPLPVGLPLWKRAGKRLFYPLLFKMPAIFLPGGKRQAAYLRHYGVGEERIEIAQMTVDVTAIASYVDGIDASRRAEIRHNLGLPTEATVFLYVGRMEPHKGVDELLDAFGQLSAGNEEVALLLVGDGSMRDKLLKMVAADPRIHWPGRLSGKLLLNAYAVADVFVLASRFEPWGLVVNEAMAAGLPVIATGHVGCVDDLIVQGETGLVVPAESANALAAAMQTLLVDHTARDQMARNARRLIAGWTLENEAGIMIDSWKRVGGQ